jgi:hypothetical protein
MTPSKRGSVSKAVVELTKRVLRLPADAFVLSSKAFDVRVTDALQGSPAIIDNPALSAKFYPLHMGGWLFYCAKARSDSDRFEFEDSHSPSGLMVGLRRHS